MKKLFKPTILPSFTLITGVIGLALRAWLFFFGIDQKGLLVASHPANALTFLLTALVLVVLFLCVRPLNAVDRYQKLFPASVFPALGCVAAAGGIAWVNFRDLNMRSDTITMLSLFLGILAIISLLFLAYFRIKRIRPVCYFHVLVTVYLMFHLISQYRLWSSEPQLQVYFFPLLASVFLMLSAYHSAVLDARKSGRRWYVFFNQSALFCCYLSMWGDSWPFYLTMGFWMLSSLCSLDVQKSPSQEEEV